jgi:mycofactocin precursor
LPEPAALNVDPDSIRFARIYLRNWRWYYMDKDVNKTEVQMEELDCKEAPSILEEITVEEMAVDGICGIY